MTLYLPASLRKREQEETHRGLTTHSGPSRVNKQLRGKAGVPGCANSRERAVPRRAAWYFLAGLGLAKSANFGTVSHAKGTVGNGGQSESYLHIHWKC
jgi:hypothetical protein